MLLGNDHEARNSNWFDDPRRPIGRMEVMLFSDALDRYAELLEKDKIVVVSGQVSFDDFNGGLKMSAREVMDLGSAREKYARGVSSIDQSQINGQFFERE